jgi:Protein of unknown function (DUF4239)
MNPTVIGFVVLACTFGGALLGMRLRLALPDHHLSTEARDTIKLGIGLVATVTALVLGLMTASAKNTFDNLDSTVKHSAAGLLSLDRTLARYGPETAKIREGLKSTVSQRIAIIWHRQGEGNAHLDPAASAHDIEVLATEIHKLVPKTDEQRALRARALTFSESLLDARWIVVAALATSVQAAFLTMLVFWLTITFTTFGVLAPRNRTVVVVLFVCALSVAGAIFLVLEMDSPFEGLITVSPGPMNYALDHMNK